MGRKKKELSPWERNNKESEQGWEAFVIYRDMGQSRSLVKVARRLNKSGTMVNRWKARHNWHERVKEWDRHADDLKRAEKEKEIREQARREIRLGKLMQKLSESHLERYEPSIVENKDGSVSFHYGRGKKIAPFDARLLGTDGARLVKSGLGEPEKTEELILSGQTFADLARLAREKKEKKG